VLEEVLTSPDAALTMCSSQVTCLLLDRDRRLPVIPRTLRRSFRASLLEQRPCRRKQMRTVGSAPMVRLVPGELRLVQVRDIVYPCVTPKRMLMVSFQLC